MNGIKINIGTSLVISVDGGSSNVKTCGPHGLDLFCSAIGEYVDRIVKEQHTDDDMEWVYEWQGEIERGFAGPLATKENEFGSGYMLGGTKNHFDAKIRVLLALHRYMKKYGNYTNITLSVCNPYGSMTKENATDIKTMLLGTHKLTVNDVTKVFTIDQVFVMSEGAIAHHAIKKQGKYRIIDCGGSTVNCVTIENGKIVNTESYPLEFGMQTSKYNASASAVAKGIIQQTSGKWKTHDDVVVCGGATNDLLSHIKRHYKNAVAAEPVANHEGLESKQFSIFTNAIGMYNMLIRTVQRNG